MNWQNELGNEWYSLLQKFVESKNMDKIILSLLSERKKYEVYPKKEDFYKMFRIFRNLQPTNIKVVFIGQDPYSDGIGTGYSFCNALSWPSKMSPALKNIFTELDNNDTEKDNLELDKMDLSRWVKQGVFLVNSYLTVRKGSPGLHAFWKPFTEYWIEKLNIYDDIIWLLAGTKAHNYINLITNRTHEIIKTSHPSPLGAIKKGKDYPSFLGSQCFSKINNTLWIRKRDMIKW